MRIKHDSHSSNKFEKHTSVPVYPAGTPYSLCSLIDSKKTSKTFGAS